MIIRKKAAAVALSALLASTPAFADTGSSGFLQSLWDALQAFWNQGGGDKDDFERFLQNYDNETYNYLTGNVATHSPEIDAGGAILALTLLGGVVTVARERRRRNRR